MIPKGKMQQVPRVIAAKMQPSVAPRARVALAHQKEKKIPSILPASAAEAVPSSVNVIAGLNQGCAMAASPQTSNTGGSTSRAAYRLPASLPQIISRTSSGVETSVVQVSFSRSEAMLLEAQAAASKSP